MRTRFAARVSCMALVATSLAYAAPAVAFTWQDDSSSTWGGDGSTTASTAGNVFTWGDLFATNVTGNELSELSFVVPFIWLNIDGNRLPPMTWSSDGGWHTDDFAGTGVGLTVRLTNTGVGTVLMGSLADSTGIQQLPLTAPCADANSSPSCQQVTWPSQTRAESDLVPIFSLGSFGPNETKRFDLEFTYEWSDQQPGDVALPTSFVAYTVSPVPEPESYLLMSLGLLAMVVRSRVQARRP